MQWDSSASAGFTTGKPWLAVNGNYPQVNVQAEEADPNSTLAYFRKLSNFRKESEILLNGDFEAILKDDTKIFAFKRNYNGKSLTVLVNMAETEATYDASLVAGKKVVISTHENTTAETLRPLEAVIYE